MSAKRLRNELLMDEEWHLAMRGAPATAIQELAGHQDLATTQRYMHLSPAALDAAIRLLEADVADGPPSPRATVGNLRRQKQREGWRNNGGGGKSATEGRA